MVKFLYIYHGGSKPETPEEGQKSMAKWQAWYGAMGESVVDGGAPVQQSYTVSHGSIVDNGGSNPVSGYTVIEAADYDAACEMAKGCPLVVDGSGEVEIAQIMQM